MKYTQPSHWSPDHIEAVRTEIRQWVEEGDLLVGIGNIALAEREFLDPQPKPGLILDRHDNPLQLPAGGLVTAGRDETTAIFMGAVKLPSDEFAPRSTGVRTVHDRYNPNDIVHRHYFATQAALLNIRRREAAGHYGGVCRVSADGFKEYNDRAWTHQSGLRVPIIDSVAVSTDVLPFDLSELSPPESHSALGKAFREYPGI